MEANHYPTHVGDEVDARDIAALLAELQDVGGVVADDIDTAANARPYSGASARRGVVGGTSVLKDQQRSANAAPGLHRRPSADGSGGLAGVAGRGGQRASASASTALAAVGFSTYSPVETGLTDAQLSTQRLSATPLGVRLTPLSGGNGVTTAPAPPPPPPKSPSQTPTPSSALRAGASRPSLTSLSALPPLPSLGTRGSGASHTSVSAAGGSGGDGALAATGLPWPMPSSTSATDPAGDATLAAAATAAALPLQPPPPREVNFLPIMCARYLRPVGLTPTARWGHTLTPITADTMLLFGGLDLHGEATASLMSFNTTTIAWEPLASLADGPAARHSHAACAYDGRYLVISGGVAQHGGAVLDDIHLYDLHTHRWRCVWDGRRAGSAQNRSEPGPRHGHTMVLQEDRLYVYGGKTTGGEPRATARRVSGASAAAATTTTATATLASGADVFVFSLSSYRWRRRVRAAKEPRGAAAAAAETSEDRGGDGAAGGSEHQHHLRPAARAHHAACVKGGTMYINGGAGASDALTDTWAVQLNTGEWRCVHRGGTADAVPRDRHAMFICGEALLLVGGCGSSGALHERITGKFTHFAVVLPLVGVAASTPCWIPVAMGNVSIVQPNKKSFAAALTGGFVYVFGGVCGAEPATNSLVRFLAADGYVSENDHAAAATGDGGAQQLRLVMQQLREQRRGVPYDCYAYAGTYGSADVVAAVAQLPGPWAAVDGGGGEAVGSHRSPAARPADEDAPLVGLHRAIVQQRAPLLLQQLVGCRAELYSGGGGAGATASAAMAAAATAASTTTARDEVDALLQQVADGQRGGGSRAGGTASVSAANDGAAAAASGKATSGGGLPVYFTNGTSRIPGLPQPLTAEALQCVADYMYWGGLKAKYRVLLEEEKDDDGGGGDRAGGSFTAEYRARLTQTLESVKAAGDAYALAPLTDLCAGLLAGDREQVRVARQRSGEQLCSDMAALLAAPSAGANTTMLVVDPHTKAQSAHALHACVLLASSDLFTELLRPLYRSTTSILINGGGGGGESTSGVSPSNQVGPLAAKLSAAATASPLALLTATSKRTVLIGPVPLPLPAVQPILRYLYTRQLQVAAETAFEVLLGAHQLGLAELQALCEAVVAREEVNYSTCCSFYYLARKYQASLLEEIALLTAVSGFSEVRYTAGYQALSEEERLSIEAVAAELGSSNWVPPPQPTTELKSKATYAARWDASAPSAL